jgi:peptide methionine sulfoxide reductase msrA/msrB
MKKIKATIVFSVFLLIPLMNIAQENMNYNKLTSEEERVILRKGTEVPGTGKYLNNKEKGTYTCKQCDAPLYRSEDKFDSHCGWPSFDDEIKGAVKHVPDPDGMRTEITCARCGAHLGHVFTGEGFTDKNTRHCVNSISMNFVPDQHNATPKTDTAIYAGGCFWGVEYFMQQKTGVFSVTSGYIGGHTNNPTYKEVCNNNTGHAEAVRIVFDPSQVTYEELTKLFFEIHDPTQINGQGPDIGNQYRSEVFYLNDEQRKVAEFLIQLLKTKGYKVATKVTKTTTFWPAEDYHQDYYEHKGTLPYCHGYTKRF